MVDSESTKTPKNSSWPRLIYKRWAIPGLFFVFSIVQLVEKILPMSGLELRISGVGSGCSTNGVTTTTPLAKVDRGASSLEF